MINIRLASVFGPKKKSAVPFVDLSSLWHNFAHTVFDSVPCTETWRRKKNRRNTMLFQEKFVWLPYKLETKNGNPHTLQIMLTLSLPVGSTSHISGVWQNLIRKHGMLFSSTYLSKRCLRQFTKFLVMYIIETSMLWSFFSNL